MKKQDSEGIRLNRFIANSGVCNRRDADELIKNGEIKVNGEVRTQMGLRVRVGKDKVEYQGKVLGGEVKRYVLINKPTDYVTEGRSGRSVNMLLRGSCEERTYPIHALDKDGLGLQLLSNDRDMIKRLERDNSKVKALYHITSASPITDEMIDALKAGVQLGKMTWRVGELARTGEAEDKEIGLMPIDADAERLIKALRHVGITVERYDRVMYAGITKKNLPRGKWRMLSDKEISYLEMASH